MEMPILLSGNKDRTQMNSAAPRDSRKAGGAKGSRRNQAADECGDSYRLQKLGRNITKIV